MGKKYKTILPFDIAPTNAALTAHGGLILPYETMEALRLRKVIDRELPRPGSSRGYRQSEFVIPMISMLPKTERGREESCLQAMQNPFDRSSTVEISP